MKLIALLVLTSLAACSNTRHLAVEPADAANANAKGACSAGPCDAGPCSAEVRCLPDGTCQVNCTGPDGQNCEVVVIPVEDDC